MSVEIPFSLDLTTSDEVKRLKSAIEIKKSKIKINRDSGTAFFQGSDFDPYKTTLSECSCMDFGMRGLPCKHMIRLAIEFGAEFALPDFNATEAASVDFDAEVKHLYDLWSRGALLTDSYIACLVALEKTQKKAKR